MTKLPSVTIEPLFLSDMFFNYVPVESDTEAGTIEAAIEFIEQYGLEDQVSAEELVKDFNKRV